MIGLIEKYILRAIFPYFLFALVFLTAILIFQQVSRLSGIYPIAFLTTSNISTLVFAITPKSLSFTLPMATLIGTLLGVSKLKSESELYILQSAGISSFRLFKPILIFSVFISLLCGYINLSLSPDVLRWTREKIQSVTRQEITSAIEIGAFNTALPNLNIYIKEGDSEKGIWKHLFITRDEGKFERVITAEEGNLDFDGRKVELVLKEVTSIKYPKDLSDTNNTSLIREKLKNLRVEVADNFEGSRINQIENDRQIFEEMSLTEMSSKLKKDAQDYTETWIQIQRRFALSFAPVILACVGFLTATAFGRSGKVYGILLSLLLLILYYAAFLTGEQFSRTGLLPAYISGWFANITLLPLILLFRNARLPFAVSFPRLIRNTYYGVANIFKKIPRIDEVADSVTYNINPATKREVRTLPPDSVLTYHKATYMGMLDLSVLLRICTVTAITYLAFISIFVVFTFFELWKSIFSNKIAVSVVIKYLLYLMPLVSTQVIGPSVLVATFVTFLLMVNRNEVIVWLSSGISVYRILLSAFVIGVISVATHWVILEYVMPKANIVQDSLRSQIKTGYPRIFVPTGRQWLVIDRRFFSYEYDPVAHKLIAPKSYTLDSGGQIADVTIGKSGVWDADNLIFKGSYIIGGSVNFTVTAHNELMLGKGLPSAYFSTSLSKPFYMNIAQLREQLNAMQIRGEDFRQVQVSLYKRFSDPFSNIIFAVFGACIGLLFRKGKTLLQIMTAIISGVSVIVVTQVVTNFGVLVGLPVIVSCWLPYLLLGAVGVYMIALLRT